MFFTTGDGLRTVLGWLDNGVKPEVRTLTADTETWPYDLTRQINSPTVVLLSCRTYLLPGDVVDDVISMASRNSNAVVLWRQEKQARGFNQELERVLWARLRPQWLRTISQRIPELKEV